MDYKCLVMGVAWPWFGYWGGARYLEKCWGLGLAWFKRGVSFGYFISSAGCEKFVFVDARGAIGYQGGVR